MARPVMLGNGALTVGLDEKGLVHDFYYPYVGLDNLTTARSIPHKIGVWVDGQFSWIDDDSWRTSVDFESEALVSNVEVHNTTLFLTLHFQDFVDSALNVFGRQVTVKNESKQKREIRIFMHQAFQISREGRADTGLFVPDENYILDYKGRCSLIIYGQTNHDDHPYDQFAIGNFGIEGKEGTFKDAEDGELSGSAVEHGGVDSVIRFRLSIAANSSQTIDYWVVAADSQFSAEKIHARVKHDGLTERLAHTRKYWHDFLSVGAAKMHNIDQRYLLPLKKSLMLIKAHTDKRGGIIASCDSSIYNYGRDYYSYVWPRDGAYAIWPLIRLGYTKEPKRFFEFCRDIADQGGYLMHKYQPDRSIGSTWHPLLHGRRQELAIQEDETAIVIYMLGEFYAHTKDADFVQNLYSTFIEPAANFMQTYVDEVTELPHASYDLWEEKFLTTTYTTAVVYQSLQVAADFAELFEYPDDAVSWRASAENILAKIGTFYDEKEGYFVKGFLLDNNGHKEFDKTLDLSSMYGVLMFALSKSSSAQLASTVAQIEKSLSDQSPSGGVPRYTHDRYFAVSPPHKGNPWFVTTLWLAQYYVRNKQHDKAKRYVDWAMQHALPSGVLSEQVDPNNATPLSVAPLVWSSAEFINTVLDLARLA